MTWSPHTTRTVSHAEARDAADRLIAWSFRRDGERLPYDSSPQFSVPADRERDSDLVLTAYLKQQEAADLVAAHTDEEARLVEEAAALRDALRTLCIQREGHFHTASAWATARTLVGMEPEEVS